ncbi:leucine-rich repeat neuronal protein 4 [Anarrhichthys ocellatus]|uniref:leucine-rich repeat neuronal protein 4 n=1 Tax=Anarrhichthys ocellatus TaxID=433405 RepID=UPI0012EE754B|nr:leucine-rich repeat neuronal protein 4-like [Anarrhichthys ocellatus]
MAANRDLAFTLGIVCLVLIRGYSPLPTTSQLAETNSTRPLTPRGFMTETFEFPTEDYSQIEENPVTLPRNTASPYEKTPKRCDYNSCLDSQIPCAALATSTGCLCPGFTLHNKVPNTPTLKSVSWNGSEVVARWCAPHSYVTAYIVKVGGQERQRFRKDQRSGGLGDMDHNTEVCVVAVNDAGDSERSCLMYPPRDSSLPLTAGLIGGALGFLLLLLLAVLLWRHKKQRKQEASISMHDTAETE